MENKYRDLHDLPMILRVEDLMPKFLRCSYFALQ